MNVVQEFSNISNIDKFFMKNKWKERHMVKKFKNLEEANELVHLKFSNKNKHVLNGIATLEINRLILSAIMFFLSGVEYH